MPILAPAPPTQCPAVTPRRTAAEMPSTSAFPLVCNLVVRSGSSRAETGVLNLHPRSFSLECAPLQLRSQPCSFPGAVIRAGLGVGGWAAPSCGRERSGKSSNGGKEGRGACGVSAVGDYFGERSRLPCPACDRAHAEIRARPQGPQPLFPRETETTKKIPKNKTQNLRMLSYSRQPALRRRAEIRV